jgi:hypothetical protein
MSRLTATIGKDHNRQGRNKIRPDAPDTARGALARFQQSAAMFLCPVCECMASVVKVGNHILQLPKSATYQVVLACGHERNVTIAVARSASVQEKMTAQTEGQCA